MEVKDYSNLISIIIGIIIIISCLTIAYVSQKFIFSKYANKTKNAAGKK